MTSVSTAGGRTERRWIAIVNPLAGALRRLWFKRLWLPRLERIVTAVQQTTAPGEATALARAAHGYRGIVAVGGDGTVNEVLAGIDPQSQQLAVVPAGRGNSLARHLGVASMAEAVRALTDGESQKIDVMQLQIHRVDGSVLRSMAASTVAFGYVVALLRRAEAFRMFGRLCYAFGAPFVCPSPMRAALAYDGGPSETRTLTGLVVSNTRFLANIRAFPDASVGDGRVDVIELTAGWALQNLHNLSIFAGRPFSLGNQRRTAVTVEIQLPAPALLLVDGEIITDVIALYLRCSAGAIDCLRPRRR